MTASQTHRVLIFEDNDEQYEHLYSSLQEYLASDNFLIQRFEGSASVPPEEELSELVSEQLQSPTHPSLVILDWDLTQYDNGVRREHVRVSCEELGIPLCVYHREPGGMFTIAEGLKKWDENVIRIDRKESTEAVAQVCGAIAEGFVEIQEALTETGEEQPRSAIPAVLGAPESAESQLDQYSWGRSEAFSIAQEENPVERSRIIATFLGYWIYNQLLQFPGVLLNPVAAASYLQVDYEDFVSDIQFQDPLSDALYDGPFAGLGTWWWTSVIDEIRSDKTESDDEDIISGPELFRRLGNLEIGDAECIANHNEAGYYCILTGKPVCKEHSVRPKGWIPIGASRSRIYENEYEKVAAWMPD